MHRWVAVMSSHKVYPGSTVCSSDIWLGYVTAILPMQQVPNIGKMAYEPEGSCDKVGWGFIELSQSTQI
jgi:hypothetical protein